MKYFNKKDFLLYLTCILEFIFLCFCFWTLKNQILILNLIVFTNEVFQINEIFEIPKDNLVSKTFVNCNLPKPEFDYIKLYYINNNSFIDMEGFLPALP